MMVLARRLFYLVIVFTFLSVFYLSYSPHIISPDEDILKGVLDESKYAGIDRDAKEKIKGLLDESNNVGLDIDAKEKLRLQARVWQEYVELSKIPLEQPYIIHTFSPYGNITKPIRKPLLFLHIPKTAGSTLSAVFKRNERASKYAHMWGHPKVDDMAEIATKDTVFGHFRYGLHLYFNRNCTYMTVLRDPIDRVISHYYYHRAKDDPGHALAMNLTFEEWIPVSPAGTNEQTRTVSGMRSEHIITNATLKLALYHLRRMALVGMTEKYHETLILLKYIAGMTIKKYKSVNQNGRRPSVNEIPESTLELIKKHNWADIELYKLGQEIFDKQLAVMPASFWTDLKAFKKSMKKKKGGGKKGIAKLSDYLT